MITFDVWRAVQWFIYIHWLNMLEGWRWHYSSCTCNVSYKRWLFYLFMLVEYIMSFWLLASVKTWKFSNFMLDGFLWWNAAKRKVLWKRFCIGTIFENWRVFWLSEEQNKAGPNVMLVLITFYAVGGDIITCHCERMWIAWFLMIL